MEKEQLIALVKKSQSGDQSAIEELLRYAHTSVSYQCRKMLKNEQDAEDMTQEVLVTIYTKLDTLQEPAAFWKWANQITTSRCINALNRTHVEYQFAEDEEGHSILDNLEELDEQVIPDKAIDNAETARMIEEIVDGLPDTQRACTLMFYYDEMSVKEIAQTMQVSENTVKSRLNYARKAIKDKVQDYEKQGIKLYGLSPLPFLLYFLRLLAKQQADEEAAGTVVTKVMAGEGAATGIAGASAAGSGSATAAAGGSAATTTATGIFSGISVKVVAGVLAAIVTVGGVAAVVIPNTQGGSTEPATMPIETVSTTEAGEHETREVLVTEAVTVPTETEPTVTEPAIAPIETDPTVTDLTMAPVETKPVSTESATASQSTVPAVTESTTTPTENANTSTESSSGDCPSCGIGNISLVLLTEPTCESRGEAAGQCDYCGYISGYSYPPANGHTSGLSEDGNYYICTVCGEILEPVGIGGGGAPAE